MGGNDVTAASGAPNPKANTPITTYVQGSAIGFVYIGADYNLYESVFQGGNGSWGYSAISASANVPSADSGSALGFFIDGSQHFVFQGSGGNIFQAWFTGAGWYGENITADAGAPPAAHPISISGNVTGGGTALPGVALNLTGTNAAGTNVSLSSTTDSNGNYSLAPLAGGTIRSRPPFRT